VRKRVLITGAAGNLGSHLARYLLESTDHELHLMTHRTPLPSELAAAERVVEHRCDLAEPATLAEACAASDVIVHFAGVLFAPRPEKFLPETNTAWARNLVDAAIDNGVERFILVSFPHVEGPTSEADPCTGRQDRDPISAHARTRLAAEKYLTERAAESRMVAISLRPGMIYGRDILMVAFARKLARRKLLGVWRKPTPIHLLSIDDFNACCRGAIERPDARGIYPLGDDAPTTLQEFLDTACAHWKVRRPWRVPLWSVYAVAWTCELFARIFRTRTPFTVDFIRIGRVPYFCDTSRMRRDLLPALRYPSLADGLEIC